MDANTEGIEGTADFTVPHTGEASKTWYKVFGDLKSAKHRPLLVVHGGPGATHDYLLPLAALAASHSIPVIFYDQIGNGRSTHFAAKRGDAAFWTEALFLAELEGLVAQLGVQDDYALLGHSWGGMLGARLASAAPRGLKRLVLANSLTAMALWLRALAELREGLPSDLKDTLEKHEKVGTVDSEEYKAAMGAYYRLHVCRMSPLPAEMVDTFANIAKDPTAYLSMYGPTQFEVTGALKDWVIEDADIRKIAVPTLLINGRYDESRDYCIQRYFDNIFDVTWTRFAQSSHMPQFEEREKYLRVVASFLLQ